jgi:hypothetical protein
MSRPANLEWPCSVCPQYDRTDRDLSDITKHLLQIKGDFSLGRCRFHPLYAAPDLKQKCPYSRLVGNTEIVFVCDLCGREFDKAVPGDPRLESGGIRGPREDVCEECRKLGRTSPIEGMQEGGPPIILTPPKK